MKRFDFEKGPLTYQILPDPQTVQEMKAMATRTIVRRAYEEQAGHTKDKKVIRPVK